MKIIFFGSDNFAAEHLRALIEQGQDVVACVTPPDRAKGRGMKISASPVKLAAGQQGIPVFQPARVTEASFIDQLKGRPCDLLVVIAYGQILPKEILALPRICAINVHASLLPLYRGAAPINWSIINGDDETGISVIRLNPRMDAGDIIVQSKVTINPQDTAISLREKLTDLGRDALRRAVKTLAEDTANFTTQDSAQVTFAPKLTKDLGDIDWSLSAQKIHDLARGLLPWPSAYTHYQGKFFKILDTEVIPAQDLPPGKPGEVVTASKHGLIIAAGQGGIRVTRVQLQAGKPMDAKSFIAGHRIQPGTVLTRTAQ